MSSLPISGNGLFQLPAAFFRYVENYVKSMDAVTLLSLVLLRQNEVVVFTKSGRRPRPAFISSLRKLRYENQKLDRSGKLVL